ncbi:voltage-dependent calcium channel subunit alpha-2/delta-4-like protein, partial [Lates japonicus]
MKRMVCFANDVRSELFRSTTTCFILLSKDRNEVGRFFGEVDGSVMASLIKMGMFK